MTSLLVWPGSMKGAPGEHVILFFILRVCFAEGYSNDKMANDMHFRKCADLCPRFWYLITHMTCEFPVCIVPWSGLRCQADFRRCRKINSGYGEHRGEKIAFLLDAPVSPSELLSTSIEAVVGKFREANVRSAAFKAIIPCTSESAPRQSGGPGPSRFEDRRQGQKDSVTALASWSRSWRRHDLRKKKQDLREVIQYRCAQHPGTCRGI